MRECVCIHIGQAGLQGGNACWELFCLVVDASKRASGGGPSVTKLWGLGRRLDDGALMLRDYENNQRRHNEARAARGLGPKQPSVIELQKAKAALAFCNSMTEGCFGPNPRAALASLCRLWLFS